VPVDLRARAPAGREHAEAHRARHRQVRAEVGEAVHRRHRQQEQHVRRVVERRAAAHGDAREPVRRRAAVHSGIAWRVQGQAAAALSVKTLGTATRAAAIMRWSERGVETAGAATGRPSATAASPAALASALICADARADRLRRAGRAGAALPRHREAARDRRRKRQARAGVRLHGEALRRAHHARIVALADWTPSPRRTTTRSSHRAW
jgi:hypothetical protein